MTVVRALSLLMAALACLHAGKALADFDHRHSAWDALLAQHVQTAAGSNSGNVRYAGMQRNRDELRRYLALVSAVSIQEFDNWPRPQQLAFLTNAYNAFTVELILTAYPGITSIKTLGSWLQSPWKKRFVPLLGEPRSLDDIEHGLIRGSERYQEPRVHFALNCASRGCPALRAKAFVGERLDTQLEDATRSFLADRSRNRFEEGALKVSSIFNWYKQDFEMGWRGANSLRQFLAMYGPALGLNLEQNARLAAGAMPIEFLDYDWRLNDASEPLRRSEP